MNTHTIIENFDIGIVAYFISLNTLYSLLLLAAAVSIGRSKPRRRHDGLEQMSDSTLMPGITLVVPGYNEEPVIVDSITSMLNTTYPTLELVFINDGSKDGTLDELTRAFDLVESGRVPVSQLACSRVRAVYSSMRDPRLVVIDKENGGKADALNCGINYARNPLVCCTDADTLLDDNVLLRLARPIALEPDVVIATGGTIRVANGSTVHNGRVEDAQTPTTFLALLQTMEYMRAFLVARTGWASINAMLIVSGALGLFRRDLVIEAGGYDRTTVGEDAELIFRLHRMMREEDRPYRIDYVPDAVCWTQAPASFKVLRRQRDRWHRGLIECLWTHRNIIANPRYGTIGAIAAPYFLMYEAIGPVIELSGLIVAVLAMFLGALAWKYVIAFYLLQLFWGLIQTIGALVLEEHAFHLYGRWRCLGKLVAAALFENLGHRQVLSLIRTIAFYTILRSKHSWGEMTRQTFTPPAAKPAVD